MAACGGFLLQREGENGYSKICSVIGTSLQIKRVRMDLGRSGNVAPSTVVPSELPEGFSMQGHPNGDLAGDLEQQQKVSQVAEQRKTILEQACTQEALARLGRIRMVREEKAKSVENSIISMALSGKLQGQINEGKMIEILERGNAKLLKATEGQISIQRKQYGIDSDDESGDDDI